MKQEKNIAYNVQCPQCSMTLKVSDLDKAYLCPVCGKLVRVRLMRSYTRSIDNEYEVVAVACTDEKLDENFETAAETAVLEVTAEERIQPIITQAEVTDIVSEDSKAQKLEIPFDFETTEEVELDAEKEIIVTKAKNDETPKLEKEVLEETKSKCKASDVGILNSCTKKKIKNKKRFHFNVILTILFCILALYTIIFFIPIIWALITTFKNYNIYRLATARKNVELMLGFNNMTVENFSLAFKEFKIPVLDGSVHVTRMFGNSILYAGGCAIVNTMVPCVVSYLVARYNYKLGKIVYAIVVVTMAIPIVGSLPSEIAMVERLNLMDSVLGLYVLKANFLGIYFLVFHAQFKSIPKDFTEAAEIDGASDAHIMLRIIFPIATGTITTVILLNFIAYWNDYQIPMIYWESRPVVAYGMYYFVRVTTGQMGATPVKLAAMIIVAIPIIVLFLIFNKKVMANMSIGGVKG